MKGRFNIFQRTMLLWNSIHPYNAVHVVRISGALDVARLEGIIKDLLEQRGIAGLSIDAEKKRFQYHSDPENAQVTVIEPGKNSLNSLNLEIQRQINTPFAGKTINPFRFFVVRDNDSFFLGLVYFHPVADADPVISFLKNIVRSYFGEKAPASHSLPDLYPGGYGYMPLKNPRDLFAWLRTLPGHIADLRRSFRPKYSDVNNAENGFSFFSISPRQFHSLAGTAKQWGVTLNDMFLAFLLEAVSPYASEHASAPRRKKISVASIVNARKDLSADNPDAFGLFLGSFSISHMMPDGIPLDRLAKDIHARTTAIKKHKLYLGTALEMRTALLLISMFFKKRLKKFYSKYYPLWGGITNINLNNVWEQSDDRTYIDYFRAVSTGPTVPLVLSFTTVGETVNVGVSYRSTVFSKEDINKIITNFSDCVNKPG